MRLVCSTEVLQPSGELWKGDYLVDKKVPWDKMRGRQRNWIPTGGILPCKEHLYEVCAWLLHVGNQQCLTVVSLVLKSLLCLLFVASL